ncbi:MAG TPA: hypothetical protein VHC98_03065 [Candidatus Saccharimonadales bacterium]|nr:hypothetical protein [Candidatus Saccharimonadales bacterium]
MEWDRGQLHHLWAKTRWMKPWYFLLIALALGSVCIIALRNNNLEMARLRDAVYTADKNGSGVERALQNLQVYVTSHMNTDLSTGPNAPYPPIQLQYTYDRAVQAAGQAASAANAKIYTDAQHYCEQQDATDFSGHNRVPCVQQYIESHGATLPSIPDSLYKFDFVSPWWSPDLAGWTLIAAVLSLAACIILWVTQRWLRAVSK